MTTACLLSIAMELGAGEIRGKVVIIRPAPKQSKIVSRSIIQRYVTKSKPEHKPTEQFDREQSRVVVYIEKVDSDTGSTNDQVATLDQTNEKFIPHALPIVVGTTVRFLNSDDVYHNVFSFSSAKSFDLGRYAKGKYRDVTFDKPGVVKIYCDIHTQMNAFILVLQNPYFTVPDEDGHFHLSDVPSGTFTIKAWYGRGPRKSQTVIVKKSSVNIINFVFQ